MGFLRGRLRVSQRARFLEPPSPGRVERTTSPVRVVTGSQQVFRPALWPQLRSRCERMARRPLAAAIDGRPWGATAAMVRDDDQQWLLAGLPSAAPGMNGICWASRSAADKTLCLPIRIVSSGAPSPTYACTGTWRAQKAKVYSWIDGGHSGKRRFAGGPGSFFFFFFFARLTLTMCSLRLVIRQ